MIMRKNYFYWAGNVSSFPREITETALPASLVTRPNKHTGGVTQKRRKLMEAWTSYCEPKKAENVIRIGNRKQLMKRR